MADQDNIGLFTLTSVATLDFPHLFEAKAFVKNGKPAGEPKFGANFIIDPNHVDLQNLKAAMAKVAKAKWPSRALGELKFPLSRGDELADKRKKKTGKDDAEHLRGKLVITARSKFPPALGGRENGKDVDYDTEIKRSQAKTKFYSGTECLAQFNFVAYEGGQGPDGVTAYLQQVYTFNRGAKIAGAGRSAAETFRGYTGTATEEDPTGGNWDTSSRDEIPF